MRTYDPGLVVITLGNDPIQGPFADGTFITVERNEELYSQKVGADGEVSRARNRNRSGKITLRLHQTSPSNEVLSSLAFTGENQGTDVLPISVEDLSGTALHSGGQAWVQKYPTAENAKETTDREWVIGVADLSMLVGSNNAD